MKTTIAKKGAYIGAGAGLVLFAIFGLLPGSLLAARPGSMSQAGSSAFRWSRASSPVPSC